MASEECVWMKTSSLLSSYVTKKIGHSRKYVHEPEGQNLTATVTIAKLSLLFSSETLLQPVLSTHQGATLE